MKRKTSLRRLVAALLATLMLVAAIPLATIPASAATAIDSVTVSGNGTVEGVNWTPGYIGSFSNRGGNAWKFVARTYAKSFRMSNVIIVPEAGTTIRFSEYCDGTNALTNNVFVVSSWKQENGAWVIDPSGVELVANEPVVTVKPANSTLGVQYYESATSTMYYTYTTTRPNEALRFSIFGAKEGGGYLAEGEGPTVTAHKATFDEGATAGEGTVNAIQWYPGYVGSSSASNFNHVNAVVDYRLEKTRYHYSMPIMIPKAGTTVTLTDPTSSFTIGSGLYFISTWTRGKDGQLDFLFGIPGNKTASCTYTTTYDNEIIRLCLNTWDGTANTAPDAVVTYATDSGEVGTLARAGHQPSNVGIVQDVSWTFGLVNVDGLEELTSTTSYYAYSSVIPVFGKGVTISYTDNSADGKFATGAYVFGIFTSLAGDTLDTAATQIRGDDTNYYTDANGARTYTYTTTADVTYLRLCYRSGMEQTIFPIVYRTAPNAVTYDENLEGLNVLVMGDSLMDLRSLWNDSVAAEAGATGSYNDINKQFIMQTAAKYNWHAINYGISGSPISNVKTNGMITRWEDMQDISPDIIILEGGGNDHNYNAPLGTFDSYDIDTLCGAINTILDGLLEKFPDALIICSTAWDHRNTSKNESNGIATRYEYITTFADLVAARNCSRVQMVAGFDRNNFPVYADNDTFVQLYGMDDTDRSHFNAEGQTILAPYYEYHISRLYAQHLASKADAGESGIVIQNAAGTAISLINTTAAGGTVTLPKSTTVDSVGKQLLGWKRVSGGEATFVAPGDTLTYAAGESAVYTPVYMGITATGTPSVRFTAGSTGMRFTTNIPLADWATATQAIPALQRGTVIVPEAYLDRIGGELTHAALQAANAQHLDVMASDWYSSDETTGTFAGSIANIKSKNYTLNFTAASYVKVTYSDGTSAYFYATDPTPAIRTIYALAYEAMHDRSTAQEGDYQYEVATGSYSPYNQTQIGVLRSFLSPVIALTGNTTPTGATLKASDLYTQAELTLNVLLADVDSSTALWETYAAALDRAMSEANGIWVITRSGGFGSANAVYGILLDETPISWTYHAATDAVIIAFTSYSDFH